MTIILISTMDSKVAENYTLITQASNIVVVCTPAKKSIIANLYGITKIVFDNKYVVRVNVITKVDAIEKISANESVRLCYCKK